MHYRPNYRKRYDVQSKVKRWTSAEIDRLINDMETELGLAKKRRKSDDQDLLIAMYPWYPPNSCPPKMGL